MKRFLRVRDYYAPAKDKLKHQYIRYISLLAVLTIMCLYVVKQVSAQEAEPAATAVADIKPLQIGDTIPEWLWHHPLQVVNHPKGKNAITLNEYRGKLIILDFWATWCAPCLAAMPKLHGLQSDFAPHLTVVPVTKQCGSFALNALKQHPEISGLGLMSICNDSILRALFPHKVVPHYSWVDKNGVYLAATASAQITSANLYNAIHGDVADVSPKIDRDPNRPLFLVEDIHDSTLACYVILKRGGYAGYAASTRVRTRDGQNVGFAMTNSTLLAIYEMLFKRMADVSTKQYHRKKLILDGRVYKNFALDELADGNFRYHRASISGLTDELFSFDAILPTGSEHSPTFLLDLLNDFSRYVGKVEVRNVKCFNLISAGSPERLESSAGGKKGNTLFYGSPPILNNSPIANLVMRLNDLKEIPYFIYDETGITYDVDIRFNDDLSFNGIKSSLETYGLKLVEANRPSAVFVISPKQATNHNESKT